MLCIFFFLSFFCNFTKMKERISVISTCVCKSTIKRNYYFSKKYQLFSFKPTFLQSIANECFHEISFSVIAFYKQIFLFFLSLRFSVKSILQNLEVLKLPFWPFQGLKFLIFDKLQPSQSAKMQNSEPLNVLKWHILSLQTYQLLFQVTSE